MCRGGVCGDRVGTRAAPPSGGGRAGGAGRAAHCIILSHSVLCYIRYITLHYISYYNILYIIMRYYMLLYYIIVYYHIIGPSYNII